MGRLALPVRNSNSDNFSHLYFLTLYVCTQGSDYLGGLPAVTRLAKGSTKTRTRVPAPKYSMFHLSIPGFQHVVCDFTQFQNTSKGL